MLCRSNAQRAFKLQFVRGRERQDECWTGGCCCRFPYGERERFSDDYETSSVETPPAHQTMILRSLRLRHGKKQAIPLNATIKC